MNVGVFCVIGDVIVFQIGLGGVGDNFMWLCLNIVKVNFFVFFVQCQMGMFVFGDFVQCLLCFDCNMIVGFWCQCQNYFWSVNGGVNQWMFLCWVIMFGVIEFVEEIDFILGIL